jgi:hypothetical protein
MFIQTIPPAAATGALKEIYERDLKANGYVPNHARALSLKPEVLLAWRVLIGAIREGMDPRRYELATVVAAGRLRCTY